MKTFRLVLLTAAAAIMAGCSSPTSPQTGSAQTAYGPPSDLNLEQLSQAAQATILRQMESEPIVKIERETRYGEIIYHVDFQRPNWHTLPTKLIVNADGALMADSRNGSIEVAMGGEAPPKLGPTGFGPGPGAGSNPASPSPALPGNSAFSNR